MAVLYRTISLYIDMKTMIIALFYYKLIIIVIALQLYFIKKFDNYNIVNQLGRVSVLVLNI